MVTEQTLGTNSCGSQGRVKILHISVLDDVYIQREDSDRSLFNFQQYTESCDFIKILCKNC